jgi:tetratricopeptide (TPR) repeat protein
MNHLQTRDEILENYYQWYFKDITKARLLIKKLKYHNDPYVLSEIAKSYFDEKKLRLAERYILKAFSIDYLNSDVLWVLGLVRWDYGQIESAIFCFKEIIRIGTRRIQKSGYNKSIDVALAQINDSKLQLYRLLYASKPTVAKRYLRMYEKGINNGIFTLLESNYRQIKVDVNMGK